MVRDLNVVSHVSEAVTEAGDGAFQDGEGMVTSNKGKQRAREPDHRMWAIRTLCLKEGRDGTKGDYDYQVSSSAREEVCAEVNNSCWRRITMTERSLAGRGC